MTALSEAEQERRDHIVWAVNNREYDDIEATGWHRVFASVEQGWTIFNDAGKPTSRLPDVTRLAWASLLGHVEPAAILNALRQWPATDGGTYCPKPADIAHLLRPRAADQRSGPYHAPRADNSEAALRLVDDLLRSGRERECACAPAPSTLVEDASGVQWCPECAGVDAGQVGLAEDLLHSAPVRAVSEPLGAVLRLKRVQELRDARVHADRVVGS